MTFVFAHGAQAMARPERTGPVRVLLSSFEKFAGSPQNTSQVIVETWLKHAPEAIAGRQVEIRHVNLPVVYGKAEALLARAIDLQQPDIVIAFGQAGYDGFRLETTAVNLDDSVFPDNDGVVRRGVRIVEGGPETYSSQLPLERMRRWMLSLSDGSRGADAYFSDSAGDYLCNHVFYQLMRKAAEVERGGRRMMAGFIHVPDKSYEVDYATWGERRAPQLGAAVAEAVKAF
jgi:pyroglutamyl-peptidase